ncbi:MAG: TolC family protein [Planctomycetota bacterium]
MQRFVLYGWSRLIFWSLVVGIISCQSPESTEEPRKISIPLPETSQKISAKTEPKIPQNDFSSAYRLEDLLAYAYESNPGILAARAKWESVLEKYPQVTTLPNPKLDYQYFYVPGAQRNMFVLSQMIPFPTKLYYDGEMVKEEVRIAHYEFEFKVKEVAVEIARTYYELCYLTQAIQLTQQNQKLLEEFKKLSQEQYNLKKAILLDVLKGEQQVAQLSYDLITLDEKKLSEEAKLNSLLNRDTQIQWGIPQMLEPKETHFSLKELQSISMQHEQELQRLDHQIKKSEYQVLRAKQNYFPDIELQLQYETRGSRFDSPFENRPENGEDSGIGISVELPIWVGKYKAEIREAQKLLQQDQLLKQEKQQSLKEQITRRYYLYENAIRLVKLYRNILIPQAKQAMDIAENLYRDAKGEHTDYLETQLVWFNFNLAYQRSLTEQWIHLIEIENLIGIRLEVTHAK